MPRESDQVPRVQAQVPRVPEHDALSQIDTGSPGVGGGDGGEGGGGGGPTVPGAATVSLSTDSGGQVTARVSASVADTFELERRAQSEEDGVQVQTGVAPELADHPGPGQWEYRTRGINAQGPGEWSGVQQTSV